MRDRDVIGGTLSRGAACTMSALSVVNPADDVRCLTIETDSAWPETCSLIVRGVERGSQSFREIARGCDAPELLTRLVGRPKFVACVPQPDPSLVDRFSYRGSGRFVQLSANIEYGCCSSVNWTAATTTRKRV